jgi:protein-S-isoprenylcysteine O-methyltransferase Ste14
MQDSKKLPKSATSSLHVLIGAIVFIACLSYFKVCTTYQNDIVGAAIFCIFSVAFTHFILDTIFLKIQKRKSTGLDFNLNNLNYSRSLIKFIGLLGTIGLLAFTYSSFPEYKGDFYNPYWELIRRLLTPWLVLAIPYFLLVDSKMKDPEDGYFHMGNVILLNFKKVELKKVRQHLLGWMVKGFFLPLMFVYFCKDLSRLQNFDFTTITSFKHFYNFVHDSIFLLDVGIVSIGYLFSLRLFDTHIRSTEPTVQGWLVAIICYDPFWFIIGKQYVQYGHSMTWGSWLKNSPVLYTIWGSLILILLIIYVWASFMFGIRFSNLTHRGIITNGPYRFTKHPAYVSKNLSWWLISIPFLASGEAFEALKKCSLLLLLNFIYFMRAKTEERHLSNDPNYQEYALWIEQNGIFSRVSKLELFKFLRYQPDEKSQI